MKNIGLLERIKKDETVFDIIPTDRFESSEECYTELERAEAAYFYYKKMIPLANALDAVVDGIGSQDKAWDLMTEEDENSSLEHCTIDITSELKTHIKNQAAKMKQYCEDLQAEIDDWEQSSRDDEKYGSYDEQVRSDFFATR